MRRNEGGIVTGWLVRIVLSLALAGLTVFEAGAIIVATVGVDGTADVAAREAALVFGTTKSEREARKVAEDKARSGGAVMTRFAITPDGRTVEVVLRRTAATRIAQYIGPLKKYTTPSATSKSPIR